MTAKMENSGLGANIHTPPKYRFRDILLGEFALADDGESSKSETENSSLMSIYDGPIKVEYYVNENTLKERLHLYFVKNQRSSLRIRLFTFLIKLLTCILYVIRVMLDDGPESAKCYGCTENETYQITTEDQINSTVNWDGIIWVNRHLALWSIQVAVAFISIIQTILVQFLAYKGSISQVLFNLPVFLELINSIPFIITIFWPPLRNLFMPIFFNCWLAKRTLESIFKDFHRALQKSQSALSQQLMILSATLVCLVFSTVCGLQHLQRASKNHIDLFSSLYCVVVTFSTVGYGDIKPDIWPSRFFMVVMICVALIVLPTQIERLAFTWVERKKLGGSYSIHRTQNEKHVVLCCTTLHADTIMDFLNEFYAHPLLQEFFVVLLSPCELDSMMKLILQRPLWSQRVIYIQGSALKDADLTRARMNASEACFILAGRNYKDKTAADEHTILRSWAVKDFAPCVPQYVQIFRPENKIHVRFAEHVVCEDEFKYALLANNCMSPGTSTLVTLLLHTSRGREGQSSPEEWHRLYGRCSGNEIYHIVLGDSRFFGEFEGKSFTYASFHAHRKYGVALVGIQSERKSLQSEWSIMLNPGPQYKLKITDICFYMSLTKEENSAFTQTPPPNDEQQKRTQSDKAILRKLGSSVLPSNSLDLENENKHLNLASVVNRGRRPSILPVPALLSSESESNEGEAEKDKQRTSIIPGALVDVSGSTYTSTDIPEIVKGFPPVSPYIGASPTLCYLLRKKKPLCCLKIAQVCEHCSNTNAKDYNWSTRAIILAADYAGCAIYNFVVPLRAHTRSVHNLNPVVLLLEREPSLAFLDAISYFPMVYWMIGSIECVDDMLKAGINLAGYVVVANKETSNSAEEDYLADCNTIVAVQTMFKLFPNVKVITELSQSSNMRFMQFKADDAYAAHLSKMEKKERERGSHISYMFRLPFAAGNVFSASMLDTLLYQAYVKNYMITFVRLLLGIDQAPFSGSLISIKIRREDLWIRTYGRLYQKLCSTSSEIPIGIYRTQNSENIENNEKDSVLPGPDWLTVELQEVENLVKCRMDSLGLPFGEYDSIPEKRNSVSYVVINPSCDLELQEGDIIYLIRPAPLAAKNIFLHESSMKYTRSMKRQKRRRKSMSKDNINGGGQTNSSSEDLLSVDTDFNNMPVNDINCRIDIDVEEMVKPTSIATQV